MYFGFFKLHSWGKRSGGGRRRFDQRLLKRGLSAKLTGGVCGTGFRYVYALWRNRKGGMSYTPPAYRFAQAPPSQARGARLLPPPVATLGHPSVAE